MVPASPETPALITTALSLRYVLQCLMDLVLLSIPVMAEDYHADNTYVVSNHYDVIMMSL